MVTRLLIRLRWPTAVPEAVVNAAMATTLWCRLSALDAGTRKLNSCACWLQGKPHAAQAERLSTLRLSTQGR